jgi:uncharacterized protein (TIGR02145 family)
MRKILLSIVVSVLALSGLFSQVPQKINYQAVIRDANGEVLHNESISLRVSLHLGSIGGQNLYSEVHHASTNEFGLVNLAIGTGQSTQQFAGIEWGGNNSVWIKIEFDREGGTAFVQMGGMELMSVPYSLYSSEAGAAPPVLENMTNEELNSIEDPPLGLMIFNTSTNKINLYQTDGWYEFGGEKVSTSFSCGKNLIDPRDQQSYGTIKIGDKCWMSENLNIGIETLGNVEMTDNDIVEKYCYNNMTSYCDTYGGLYQWNEMMAYSKTENAQGICPDGWHVPSDGEVQELEMALGMDASIAALTNIWRGSDEGTQMAMGGGSGYEALFSGRRVTGGLYSAIDNYEYLYTSTEAGSNAWRRCLRVADNRVGRYNTFPKTYGMSIRCVQDN